jgi:hypothetical protein
MATKSKSKPSKSKPSKSKPSKSKPSKSKPSKSASSKSTPSKPAPHLPEGMEVNVPLHNVMRILKMIARRHAGPFARKAEEKGVLMIAPAETVNFVKDFLVDNKLDKNPIGKHIVNARVKEAEMAEMVVVAEATGGRDLRDCNSLDH